MGYTLFILTGPEFWELRPPLFFLNTALSIKEGVV